jgi:hypothetical protein
MNAAEGALLSACEENVTGRSEAKRSAAGSFFEGASAARTAQHPENRRRLPQQPSTREENE